MRGQLVEKISLDGLANLDDLDILSLAVESAYLNISWPVRLTIGVFELIPYLFFLRRNHAKFAVLPHRLRLDTL